MDRNHNGVWMPVVDQHVMAAFNPVKLKPELPQSSNGVFARD
jgi:hypothetical protein